MVSKLAAGDEVVTAGGILGKVIEVGDKFLTLEIADERAHQGAALSGHLAGAEGHAQGQPEAYMLEYARWKYILVGVVLAVALLFALPNLFGDDFAIQIARKDHNAIDAPQLASIETTLKQAGVTFTRVELDNGNVIVRFADNDAQLKGRDIVKDEKTGLNKTYVNAMMYASRAPRWIQALGLRAMPLGLDLRGGLYLLYQVDVDGAVAKLLSTYDQDLRRALETEKIPFTDITSLQEDSDIPNGLRVLLPAGADLGAVRAAIKKDAARSRLPRRRGGAGRRGGLRDVQTAGARTPRFRHHLQHHHAAQSRERARCVRADRAAAGSRPHQRAAARRAELRRSEEHARQGRDARIPARRSASHAGEWPRAARREDLHAQGWLSGDAQARDHRDRRPDDQRDLELGPAGPGGQRHAQ